MSPSYQHSYVCTNLGSALKSLGKYSIFTELTLVIEKDYLPDISIYPKRTIIFGVEDIIKMTEMPITAIEILSLSQTMQDALDKFKVYFGAGIKSCCSCYADTSPPAPSPKGEGENAERLPTSPSPLGEGD